MSKWAVRRVRELAALINGYPFDAGEFADIGGIPLVRIRDIASDVFETYVPNAVVPKRVLLRDGDVVIGMDGDFNLVLWRRGAAALNQRVCALRDTGRSDMRFLAYALPPYLERINDLTYSTTVKHLASSQVQAIRLPAPPLPEQRAIADYLDRETAKIDTLIEKQTTMIERLRERREAVIDAAFAPNEDNRKRIKLGRLLAARPRYGVLVPSYVDEGPETVQLIRVGDLPGLPVIETPRFIAGEQSREYARTVLRGGEVLLGVVGKMGTAAVAPASLAGANVVRAVAVLKVRGTAANAQLLRYWIGSSAFARQAHEATAGDSVQPTLGMADLSRFAVCWPTDPVECREVADYLDRETAKIDTLIAKVERHIELAKERRAALITAAVTGHIDVTTSTQSGDAA